MKHLPAGVADRGETVQVVERWDVPLATATSTAAPVTLTADDHQLAEDEQDNGYREYADDGPVEVRYWHRRPACRRRRVTVRRYPASTARVRHVV